MKKIHVNLGEHSYNIEIGLGLLDNIGDRVSNLLPKAKCIAIISDSNVAPLYSDRLCKNLENAGFRTYLIAVEAGEQSKNLSVFANILEQLAEIGLTRSDAILTLGGGVVGDLGGFVAATYMRGIAFVQIPTSLLAQIDSSVGGKVAVDLKAGKNLAGAFYQPKAVYIDPEVLKTLPVRFLHDAMAEAIKYGAIFDAKFFEKIISINGDVELLDNIDEIIERCCMLKAAVVEKDELDTGLRGLLNFGHTLGHSIEQYHGFSGYTHGEGVGIGMYQLTLRTEKLGISCAGTSEKIKHALKKYNLPTDSGVDNRVLLSGMKRDKKKNGDKITLVILEEIGKSILKTVDWSELPKFYL